MERLFITESKNFKLKFLNRAEKEQKAVKRFYEIFMVYDRLIKRKGDKLYR